MGRCRLVSTVGLIAAAQQKRGSDEATDGSVGRAREAKGYVSHHPLMPCRRIGRVPEYRRLALEIPSPVPVPRRHGSCGDDR